MMITERATNLLSMCVTTTDPKVIDWANTELPSSRADKLSFLTLEAWRSVFSARQPVELPEKLLGRELIPNYVLQEFHNLPNGSYSNSLSRGYITGFDLSMLGSMQAVRHWIADELTQSGDSLLDVGTAGGKVAAAAVERGMTDVWGIDPSPYLLKHAAKDNPKVKFVQGIAEDLPFVDKRFSAAVVCFVFHEIPPKYIATALAELYRVMKPGAKLCIAEPSPEQLKPFHWNNLLPLSGWKKIYFRFLANFVYEPFLPAWHKLDKQKLFVSAGFEVVGELPGMPINRWILQRN